MALEEVDVERNNGGRLGGGPCRMWWLPRCVGVKEKSKITTGY